MGSEPGTLVTDLLENFLLTNSVMLLRLETTGELPDQLVSTAAYGSDAHRRRVGVCPAVGNEDNKLPECPPRSKASLW